MVHSRGPIEAYLIWGIAHPVMVRFRVVFEGRNKGISEIQGFGVISESRVLDPRLTKFR